MRGKLKKNKKKAQKTKKAESRRYTPWHINLGDALRYYVDPDDMDIMLFEKLGTLPLEADMIIIMKKSSQDLIKKYPELNFIIPYLSKYTVIEYKSPLDRLTYDDFDTGRAYKLLTKRKYEIKYEKDINIIFLCSAFEKGYDNYIQNNGFRFNKIESGIHGHITENGSNIYWINLKEIGEKDPGNVFKFFSKIEDYKSGSPIDGIRDLDLLYFVAGQMFSNKEDIMRRVDLRQKKEFANTMESFKTMFLSHLSAQERVAGLKPEEIVKEFGPEKILRGFRPEEILKNFRPEDRLKGLGPEDRLKGLGPEDIRILKEYLDKA